jgi:hypothetical protein
MSRTEQMNDFDQRMVAAAEADLQQLLAIEPSPEFAARVRVRVHERRESPAKVWGWFGLATVTAAALAVAVVVRTPQSVPEAQTIEMVHRSDVRLSATPLLVGDTTSSTSQGTVKVARHYSPPAAVTQAGTPEIIIDPAMTAAIRRMAMLLRTSEPDASAAEQLQTEVGEPAPLVIADPLNVPELVLKPADQNGGDQE